MLHRSPVDAQGADDDLFRPTLTASDDALHMGRPWDPMSLWITTYLACFAGALFGVLGSALLFGLNGVRLGRPRAGMVLAVGMVVIAGVATLARFVLIANDMYSPYAGRIGPILLGLVGWLAQRSRFRMFVVRGGEPARALWPGLAVIVGSYGVSQGASYLLLRYLAGEA